MRLFCFPFAGGSEAIYYNWKKYIDSSIQVVPIELKGRGRRSDEKNYENLHEVIEDVFENIKNQIFEDEYAIWGHSMGSLIAYEFYYKICDQKIRKPKHIFFSGYRAPNIIEIKEKLYTLSDKDFINEVIRLGGTPEELASNKELLEIFLPVLRNDFKICETYQYVKRKKKIECEVSILNGTQDIYKTEEILEWNNLTCKQIHIYNFAGNHFYIHNNIDNICNIINATLNIKK